MLQACAQIKFLQHRMEILCLKARQQSEKNINERTIIKKCVKHYMNVIDFAESTNEIFTYTIFLQYSISAVIICACMYNLTNVPFMSSAFISITMYLTCMLVQMFIVCFYGTIITYESANMGNIIYCLDWTALSLSGQKCLILMMVQAQRPIVFTSGHVVVLSLESFTAFCKLSYSAFNLLIQQT
uniref:Olfactory receptor 112 n=1 Tax=Aulacocentrum confusum TaxID=2767324 RepID=A0A7G8Z9D1_9HYME|nr:olfactory receptor 112 [Aulacocentrum confusum]